ncbi:protein UXT isoform X1 [Carettochelys insculpta]|uniref:protein UXT isoform X1 n=1 Tax=Carettochelys insculpta TaxID=44489 RepID=UPI003EB9855C
MGAEEKVPRYEAFVSDVLQRDLRRVQEQREQVHEEITQHLRLKALIERLQESDGQAVQTQVDLGCNFFVTADVPDTSRIFVALGYGFFAELTLLEALRFVDRKTKLLMEPFSFAGSANPSPRTPPRSRPTSGWSWRPCGNSKASSTNLKTPEETLASRSPLLPPRGSAPPGALPRAEDAAAQWSGGAGPSVLALPVPWGYQQVLS